MPAFGCRYLFSIFIFLNTQWNIKKKSTIHFKNNNNKKRLCVSLWFLFYWINFSLFLVLLNGYDEVKWPIRDEKSSYNAQRCEKEKTKRREAKRKKVQTHTMWIMIAHHSMWYYSFLFFIFFLGKIQKEKEREQKGDRGWELRDIILHIFNRIQYTVQWNVICKTAREILLAQQFVKEKRILEQKKIKNRIGNNK